MDLAQDSMVAGRNIGLLGSVLQEKKTIFIDYKS